MSKIINLLFASLLLPSLCLADTATVDWFNNASTQLKDAIGANLSQGATGTNKDGAKVQLGYFSTGTTASNFLGTWIPITLTTTIGDSASLSGSGAGIIAFNSFFTTGTNVVDIYDSFADSGYYTTNSSVTITSVLPANNQVMAIRFFDSTAGTSGKYNTVSSDSWLWVSPTNAGSTMSFNLATSTLEWEDSTNAFKTSLTVVPEPSTYALLAMGALVIGGVSLKRKAAKI